MAQNQHLPRLNSASSFAASIRSTAGAGAGTGSGLAAGAARATVARVAKMMAETFILVLLW